MTNVRCFWQLLVYKCSVYFDKAFFFNEFMLYRKKLAFYLKKNFFLMFIYFWCRERQSMSGGGSEREGDTESEAGSRLQAVSTEPDAGLELTNREIMTWAEVGRSTDWATRAPQRMFVLKSILSNVRMDSPALLVVVCVVCICVSFL